MSDSWPLEPDAETLSGWLSQASAMVVAQLEALPTAPARGDVGAAGLAVAQAVSLPIAEHAAPGGMAAVLERVVTAAGASLGTPGPGYFAYIPGGGIPSAAVASLVANALNRYTGLSAAAPALCRLEADVLSWLAAEFGYDPVRARGLLTSGGSLANFSALVTARHVAFGDTGDYSRAVVYASSQAHHSVAKAAALAGIPTTGVRMVAIDDRCRMDAAALDAQIREDLRAGLRPFAIVSAAGTTNTGAVDPLPAVCDIAAEHGVWHHVDAAYGGGFILCDEGKRRLVGIDRADSVTFDPHKGMFLPYGSGCLLVADGAALKRAHGAAAAYLQDFDAFEREGESPSPAEYGPELSRPYRGLSLWLPLQLHGAAPFREAAAEKLALATRFAEGLQRLIDEGAPIEILDPPQLSVVPFRLRRQPGEALAAYNARNARWMAGTNDRLRAYLSSTTLPVVDGEAFTLRVCILSFRTHQAHVDHALQDLAEALAGVV
ncbi:MAG: aminotransferase class I/II-fold pyridoxal phosphate-dependent enzyme [Myxococcota bacterium]